MSSKIAVLILLFVSCYCDGAVNYCGAKMCGYTDAHTFCQYPAGPSPSCAGYVTAPLTPEEKGRILSRMNRRRSDVATGRLKKFPTAGDMLKLRWVEELAREAQRWADQCRPPQNPDEHDACRDLYSVSVGQSVASVVGEAPGLRAESMVDMWYLQNIHYKGNVTYYMQPMSTINYYGDFAQIVWSYTYMVGCGRSRFMIQLNGRMRTVERLVCNFAPRGPASGQPVWNVDEPASACPPRSLPDTEFTGLCAYQPVLEESISNITTKEENTLLSTIFEIEMNEVLNYPGSLDEVYLTKIAIATMDDKAVTEPYNNFQKIDIGSSSDTLNNNQDNHTPEGKEISHIKIEETSRVTPTQTTVKVNLIGRHKSYNADDLIDVGGVQTKQNHEILRGLPNDDGELYADYQYLESHGELLLSTQSQSLLIGHDKNARKSESSSVQVEMISENIKMHSESNHLNNNLSLINVSYVFKEDKKISNDNTNKTTENINSNSTRIDSTLKDEELLSDPQVVRDLELALGQMEQHLETSTIMKPESEGSEKVKRESRERSYEEMQNKPREYLTTPTFMQEVNSSIEKNSMLNMILKYFPYLKPYNKDLLGKVTNKAMNSSPTCFVSVIVFIVSLIYF